MGELLRIKDRKNNNNEKTKVIVKDGSFNKSVKLQINPGSECVRIKVSTSGARGKEGKEGKSSYELAKDLGFEGSLEDWLSSFIVRRESVYEFPNIGSELSIYIDTSDNSVYRYDAENCRYYCIGRDWESIKVVDGGSANV